LNTKILSTGRAPPGSDPSHLKMHIPL